MVCVDFAVSRVKAVPSMHRRAGQSETSERVKSTGRCSRQAALPRHEVA